MTKSNDRHLISILESVVAQTVAKLPDATESKILLIGTKSTLSKVDTISLTTDSSRTG